MQSNFDKRDSLKREKAYKRKFSVRPDSFYRQNVQRLADNHVSGSFARMAFPPAYRSSTLQDLNAL
jgi:hypothetical protein